MIEWINVTRAHDYLAPPRLLPLLLDFGQSHIDMRLPIADIVGNRGQWLARQMKKWSWLDGNPNQTVNDEWWNTGTPAQRELWFNHYLISDPQRAADAIIQAWTSESADAREAFVKLASLHPDPVHEHWLERALSERRQSVRQLATSALMAMPDAGFRQRSLQRAAMIVELSHSLLKGQKISVNPPKAFDPQWVQDGIREKPPSGIGPKAFWIIQILSALPLQDWITILNHNKPFSLKIDPDWSDTILTAWQRSARQHSGTRGLASLLKQLTETDKTDSGISSITQLLAGREKSQIADLLEPLKLSEAQQLALLRQLLPALNAQRHRQLHKTASDWVSSPNSVISKSDAVALASCCDRYEIPNILERIGRLKSLSAPAEEFAWVLEFRYSYLKHFPDHNDPNGPAT
ncbi:MAG: DUF5691 domain-containing protein [Granulosicoccus sp.]